MYMYVVSTRGFLVATLHILVLCDTCVHVLCDCTCACGYSDLLIRNMITVKIPAYFVLSEQVMRVVNSLALGPTGRGF